MRSIMTATAAVVLIAGAAHAQGKGGGHGGGGHEGGGGGHASGASMQGGGGNGHGNGNHGGGGGGEGGGKDRGNAHSQGGGGEARVARGNSGGNSGERSHGNVRVADNRGHGNAGNGNREVRIDDHGRGNGNRAVVIDDRGHGRNNGAVVIDGRGRGDVLRVNSFRAVPSHGLIGGCPPGLAKKNPPCIPPGQVRNSYVRYDRPDFWGLRLGDGRYRYDDGYLLRFAPDGRIGGYIPLLGGALAIGNPWPTFYQPVALPAYYENYYGLGQYNSYRYADNVIYRVDPKTAAITSVAALLTGDDFVVGQPMPVGYDVYNVPYTYRAQYADSPTAMYRYADGYVYQLDPKTRLIADAIELLAS